jgi:hypothetical protein
VSSEGYAVSCDLAGPGVAAQWPRGGSLKVDHQGGNRHAIHRRHPGESQAKAGTDLADNWLAAA